MQAAEVSQALATGVIDSYMSSGATGYDSKTYEHLKRFYDTQAWLPKNAVIVNKAAFDALDKPAQAAVLKAAADAETRGWKISAEKTNWYTDQLKQHGFVVSGWSPDRRLPEIMEFPDHPWFIGVQFHPELKSRPLAPHPLFTSFIAAAVRQSRLV